MGYLAIDKLKILCGIEKIPLNYIQSAQFVLIKNY